jgi:hypothetical protein
MSGFSIEWSREREKAQDRGKEIYHVEWPPGSTVLSEMGS